MEVTIRLTFAPILVQPDCLYDNGAVFGVRVAGHEFIALFDRAERRELTDALNPDTTASLMLSAIEVVDYIESDSLFLVLQHTGDVEGAKALVDEIALEVEAFRILVEQWGDSLSEQAPSPLHAVRSTRVDARLRSGRLVTTHDANAEPPGNLRIFTFSFRDGLDVEGMRAVLDLAAAGTPVPIARQMMQLAKRSAWRGEYRMAATEAGIAAELSLAEAFVANSDVPRERVARWTLGTLCNEMEKRGIAFPAGYSFTELMEEVVEVRNDAVHRGKAENVRTNRMLELGENLVREAFPVAVHLQ